jgi:hypothetical protein
MSERAPSRAGKLQEKRQKKSTPRTYAQPGPFSVYTLPIRETKREREREREKEKSREFKRETLEVAVEKKEKRKRSSSEARPKQRHRVTPNTQTIFI